MANDKDSLFKKILKGLRLSDGRNDELISRDRPGSPDDAGKETGENQTPRPLSDDIISPAEEGAGDQEPSHEEAPPEDEPGPDSPQGVLLDDLPAEATSSAGRQKHLMALGERVKRNPDDKEAIRELVSYLADPESTLRWLASSTLKIVSSRQVVIALAEFLNQDPGEAAQWEAMQVLGVIAGTSKDDGVQEVARRLLGRQ